jgi:hypothetical protein
LKTNFQLTAAIMEALDSLSLDSTLRTEVCQLMLQTLNRAPPEFLPAIVGFLISSDEPIENLMEVGYNFGSCNYIIRMLVIIMCNFIYAYIFYQYTVKAGLSGASRTKQLPDVTNIKMSYLMLILLYLATLLRVLTV